MPKSKTAAKVTKAEKAYEALRHAVLQGEIQEGTFLSEAEITRRFGIGRTPYREACNRLHHEGILEVVPRRGYLVPELSFHTVRNLFELRLILEGSSAELATLRAGDAEIEELERFTGKSDARARDGCDAREIIGLNNEFHLRLARMSKNQELVRLVRHLLERTARLMYIELQWSPASAPADAFKLHLPVIAALRRRDRAAVRQALIDDISDAQNVTLSVSPRRWRAEDIVPRLDSLAPEAAPGPARRGRSGRAAGAAPPPNGRARKAAGGLER